MSDQELLRRYLREGTEADFALLVQRHLDFVYSVARRQVRSSHLAEEVAQSVFVELARRAPRIDPDAPLVAWLHVVSRRIAIDVVRRETRRHAREQHAALLADADRVDPAMTTPSPAWAAVEPLLDEAVESLSPPDRTAVLLRYFQNQSLREIGTALGASEDAAQKRVSRAVEQLRAFFVRRGIAVTAAGLATDLSAAALQTAPAGLGITIANAAAVSTVATSAVALELPRVIAMTTLQKSLITAAVLVVGSAGVYEAKLAARQVGDLTALRAQTERSAADLRMLRAERDAAAARLKAVEQQIDTRLAQARAADPTEAAMRTEMASWLTRMDRIKQLLIQRPELSIPELQYLKEEQWFTIAGGRPLENDEDARRVLAQLRSSAEQKFSSPLSIALRSYVAAHDGLLPTSPRELEPYLIEPIERTILDRYEMLRSGKAADIPPRERMQVMAPKSPPDPEFDSYTYISPSGHGSTPVAGINLMNAWQAFTKEHPGERLTSAAQLKPYLKWPMSDAAVQKYLEMMTPYLK